jgi:GH24 family phage-related lysozyme (muramidase)
MKLNKKGVAFIVEEETGGKEYYEKVYKSTFIWPGGASGATAMVGIDIGYYTAAEVDLFFKPLTTPDELELIQDGRGKKGLIAKAYVKKYLNKITFTWEEAIQTFENHTLPKFIRYTKKAFPGVENLEEDAQTALVSLVFNRGMAMKGPSRKEMLIIRQLVPDKDYCEIAKQIRGMKRLWDKTSGLVARRDKEAKLVEGCA